MSSSKRNTLYLGLLNKKKNYKWIIELHLLCQTLLYILVIALHKPLFSKNDSAPAF